MGIKVRITDALGNLLGASWAAPIKAALFGTGGGDYHSPVSFTATPTGNSQVTLSGLSPTVTNASQFRAVRAYAGDGSLVGEWRPSKTTRFVYNSLTSVLTVKGANWGSAAYLDVELHAEHRGFAPTEDAYQSYSVNPPWERALPADYTATSQGDGTTYYYVDFDGYKYGAWQIATDTPGAAGDQTYTVEASWEDNTTAQASADYTDMTLDWFGAASVTSAAITADPSAGVLEIDTPKTPKFLRLKVVRANDGAATDGGWDIHFRATY
jgi:hypothetical protein